VRWRHRHRAGPVVHGGAGWGNLELQTYTDRPESAVIRGGALVITARAERFTGRDGIARDYTSARLTTKGRFAQTHGRFEARIQIPRGQGLWPAFWMLGADIDGEGWPACGEIDIMENVGSEPASIHGALHGPGFSGDGSLTASVSSPDGAAFAGRFHLFAVEWEPSGIRWLLDDRPFASRRPPDLPAGGRWPGPPDASTTFPQEMKVDYVRVFRRN
jgi:beta-glucanase (GH16 family)